MKEIIIKTTSIVLLLVTNQVYATHATIVGPGSSSCGNWTDARKGDGNLAANYESWVKGFLSGINITNYYSADILEDGGNLEERLAWIDSYCKQNPQDAIAIAADNLIHDLTKSKKTSQ